jgi:CRP-like cAMP-binding protein/Zn-dependent peptidase ImmA (M78 family)
MTDPRQAQEEAAEAEAFDQLFAKAETYFDHYLRVLHSYGILPDPEMKLQRARGLNNYYDLKDGQIHMALPSLRGGAGQLYLAFLKSIFGTESNQEILEIIDLLLPRIVAHELGHSLRHRYRQFHQDNLWLEEQAANQLAMALIKRQMTPDQKRRVREMLARAVAKLGEKIETKDIGLDSYRNVEYALNVTQQIGDATLTNIELLRSIFTIDTDKLLRASGQLPEEVLQAIDQRQEVIDDMNEQYTNNAARYAYSHFSWMYYDFLSQRSEYIVEFAVTRLGLKYQVLPEIDAAKVWDRIEIQALYRAYQSVKNKSELGRRFFYKRYRTSLLNRMEITSLNTPTRDVENDLSALMEIWSGEKADPMDMLELVCPPELQKLFPKYLAADPETISMLPAKLLPTETDRRLWKYFTSGEPDAEAANTVRRLEILDNIPMLRPLSAELQLNLLHHMYTLILDSGEPVIWRGERNSDIFIIVEGLLEILVEDGAQAKAKHVGLLKPGSLFGEYSFIANEAAGATIRAVRPSKCYVFKGDDLKPLTYRHPAILVQFAASLAEKLNHANQSVAAQERDRTVFIPSGTGPAAGNR